MNVIVARLTEPESNQIFSSVHNNNDKFFPATRDETASPVKYRPGATGRNLAYSN